MTKAIVDQLRFRLLPEEMSIFGQAPTDNVEAYSLYLKGRQFFHNPTKSVSRPRPADVRQGKRARSQLFARAFAGIANCDARMIGWYGEKIPLERDPSVSAGKGPWRSIPSWPKRMPRGARLSGLRAVARKPWRRSSRRLSSIRTASKQILPTPGSHAACGDLDRSVELFIRALEIQQTDYQAPLLLQSILHALGRREEAEKYARLGLCKRAEEALRKHPEGSRPAQLPLRAGRHAGRSGAGGQMDGTSTLRSIRTIPRRNTMPLAPGRNWARSTARFDTA